MQRAMSRHSRTIAQPPDAVEIVDGQDRPLGVMPLAEARRQALFHRTVLVLVYDAAGRVFLQKRARTKALYPGRWDLSAAGPVLAGEACEDAALRGLRQELGLGGANLTRLAQAVACPETGYGFTTLFSAGVCPGPLLPDPAEIEDGLFVDRDELDAMVANFREMLTPSLVSFWERDLVFRPERPGRPAPPTPGKQGGDAPDDEPDEEPDEAPDDEEP
jgi:isopentenyl-diphosphate delta-isomerase